jgi:mono/diheme cytochrome c family protein
MGMAHIIVGFIFMTFLAGCSNAPVVPPPYQPDLANGKALYVGQCGGCHDSGNRNAPSIRDPEEWDIQTLTRPGIVRQHLALNLLSPAGARLSEYDEMDVLSYVHQEIGDREANY